jgi:hypothetical protein
MKQTFLAALCGAAVVFGGSPAAAQTAWEDRGFLTVNFGVHGSPGDVAEDVTFTEFVEEGTFTADYEIGGGGMFDVGAGFRIWGNLGAGVSVSSYSKEGPGSFELRVPHPFFFNAHRPVVGEFDDLSHTETGVHIQVMYVVPAGDRFRIALSGGPSFISVKQDFVQGATYREVFPYDVLVDPVATIAEETERATGFNVGADLMYLIGERWGVGGLVRFTRGTATFTIPSDLFEDRELEVDAGGAQIGGGVRFLF